MQYLDELIEDLKKKPKKGAEEKPISTQKKEIASYGSVHIYKDPGQPLPIYEVPITKPTGPEKVIVNTIQEAATRLITVFPEEIRDVERRKKFFFNQVKDIILQNPELKVPPTKIDFYSSMVVQEMIGYGLLDPLVDDPKLEEIMVVGPNKPVYVFHQDHEMMITNIVFGSDQEIYNIISRIARDVNRRIDVKDPILDARLPDGSRVNATIPPISVNGATLTIRKFRVEPLSIVDMVQSNVISSELAAFLWLAVSGSGARPANILVSGGTSSGKTTMLNVLASMIPARERVISIEDTAELILPVDNWIRFETRPPGLEGTGEVDMNMLVKNSLRMRPDRIIVGEIRSDEAFTLFTAINTGHQGSMGTVHANSAEDTLIRVLNPPMNVPPAMLNALNFIVTQQRIYDRRKGTIRRVIDVAEVFPSDGEKPKLQIIFDRDPASDKISRTSIDSIFEQTLRKYSGMTKQDLSKELQSRQKFIEMLISKGITKQVDVVAQLRKYEAQANAR